MLEQYDVGVVCIRTHTQNRRTVILHPSLIWNWRFRIKGMKRGTLSWPPGCLLCFYTNVPNGTAKINIIFNLTKFLWKKFVACLLTSLFYHHRSSFSFTLFSFCLQGEMMILSYTEALLSRNKGLFFEKVYDWSVLSAFSASCNSLIFNKGIKKDSVIW